MEGNADTFAGRITSVPSLTNTGPPSLATVESKNSDCYPPPPPHSICLCVSGMHVCMRMCVHACLHHVQVCVHVCVLLYLKKIFLILFHEL